MNDSNAFGIKAKLEFEPHKRNTAGQGPKQKILSLGSVRTDVKQVKLS